MGISGEEKTDSKVTFTANFSKNSHLSAPVNWKLTIQKMAIWLELCQGHQRAFNNIYNLHTKGQ